MKRNIIIVSAALLIASTLSACTGSSKLQGHGGSSIKSTEIDLKFPKRADIKKHTAKTKSETTSAPAQDNSNPSDAGGSVENTPAPDAPVDTPANNPSPGSQYDPYTGGLYGPYT